ncbi:3-keto-steroid reductase [Bienertia sinuspersici]
MIGDFNCVISMEERIGSTVRQREIDPMRRCISDCDLHDIPYNGHFYTWSNKKVTETECGQNWIRLWQMKNGLCYFRMLMQFFSRRGLGKVENNSNTFRCGNRPLTTLRGSITQKLKRVKASLKELNKQGFNNLQAENTRT